MLHALTLHYLCTEKSHRMEAEAMHIDIREAIMQKMPRYGRRIPGFVYSRLAKIIRQRELNRILDENAGKTGVEFAKGVLNSLDIKLNVSGMENIPDGGRYIFAGNHPLGGLDGIALIALLGEKYDGQVKFVVNDVLMAVRPLRNVFLPVNKYGTQSRQAIRQVDEAFAGDEQMLVFPAGLCSRMDNSGKVCDLEWQKSFITKSEETHRDVVPIYFNGLNSRFFYKFAQLRKRLGLKFNIELILLPGEMIKSRGCTFDVRIGKPIPYTTFDKSRSPHQWAQTVKAAVYRLAASSRTTRNTLL